MEENKNFLRFMGRLYDDLYKKGLINKGSLSIDLEEKKKILEEYTQKIERVQKKARGNKKYLDEIQKMYHQRYLAGLDDFPEKYGDWTRDIIYPAGHRLKRYEDFTEFDFENIKKHKEMVIYNQKQSLNIWINYLLSEEADYLKPWEKIWIFQGMQELVVNNYDTYEKRRDKDYRPFIPMSPLAIYKSINELKEKLNERGLTEEELEKYSFARIYLQQEAKVLSNEGEWKKFEKDELEEADHYYIISGEKIRGKRMKIHEEIDYVSERARLSNSLVDFDMRTDRSHDNVFSNADEYQHIPRLHYDTYVYYSKDEMGNNTIPRLTMEIDERGYPHCEKIGDNGSIDDELDQILIEQGKELFGHPYVFCTEYNCKEYKAVQVLKDEIYPFDYKYKLRAKYIGNVRYPEDKEGSINVESKYMENVKFPEKVKGNFIMTAGGSLENITYPKVVDGSAYITIHDGENQVMPEEVDYFELHTKRLGNIKLPRKSKKIQLPFIRKIDNYVFEEGIKTDSISLPHLLEVENLEFKSEITNEINLQRLKVAKRVKFPENFNGNIALGGLEDISGLEFPPNFTGTIERRTSSGSVKFTLEEIKEQQKEYETQKVLKRL